MVEAGAEPVIEGDNLERLFGDLRLDLVSDIEVLIICFHMKTAVQGVITKEEWVRGFNALG